MYQSNRLDVPFQVGDGSGRSQKLKRHGGGDYRTDVGDSNRGAAPCTAEGCGKEVI